MAAYDLPVWMHPAGHAATAPPLAFTAPSQSRATIVVTRFSPGGSLVNSRISAALAALVLICTTALATPPQTASFSNLATLAHAVDGAAQRGDWSSAQQYSRRLHVEWASLRPETLHGLKGKAYAQNFDASLKWVNSAIAQRSPRNVHNATVSIEKSVRELEERARPG
jgi:hypothetical protein